MNNTLVTGSSQANAEQQAIQNLLQQQATKNGTLTVVTTPPVSGALTTSSLGGQLTVQEPSVQQVPVMQQMPQEQEVQVPVMQQVQEVQVPVMQQMPQEEQEEQEVQVPVMPQEEQVQVMQQEEQEVQVPKKKTWKKDRMQKLYMIYLALVLVGALNWGLVAIGYNPVEMLSNFINNGLNRLLNSNRNYHFNTIIYSLVAVSAIILAIQRDVWLPFLGRSVLPSALVPLKNPTAVDTVVEVYTKPNTKIAYWAALPIKNGDGDDDSDSEPDVMTAYGDFSNSGVVMSDDNGLAQLHILAGTSYEVPSGKVIPRHVHYRIINEHGMMGRIRTKRY